MTRMLAVIATLAAFAATASPAALVRADAPTLAVAPATLVYGKSGVVLSGVVASRKAGEEVTILSQPCRFTEPSAIATVRSTAGGAFRFRVQPMLNTTFRVRAEGAASRPVNVRVRPVVELKRLRAGRYRAVVSTTNPVFLDGRPVLLQRASGKRWVTIKRATLAKASSETEITVLSAATFAVKTTGKLRATVPMTAGSCYLGASSPTLAA
jgi:hypothetical protein